jgi:hypothetical protein
VETETEHRIKHAECMAIRFKLWTVAKPEVEERVRGGEAVLVKHRLGLGESPLVELYRLLTKRDYYKLFVDSHKYMPGHSYEELLSICMLDVAIEEINYLQKRVAELEAKLKSAGIDPGESASPLAQTPP